MNCKYCETASQATGTYKFTCAGCRTRFIQRESCKYLRKVLVEYYAPKYGEFDGWKEGKTCSCERVCDRKLRVKKDTDEQQIVASRKKASSKR